MTCRYSFQSFLETAIPGVISAHQSGKQFLMNHWIRRTIYTALLAGALTVKAGPRDCSDQFELPPGFHIYRAAPPEITGGSYALTFDGEGRLLVGDGSAVRRLADNSGSGVFDSFEVIAKGLGPRGPQGLLVYEDRLYAVGGDGVQLFSGYGSGAPLAPHGRLGQPFRTGGDHDAHTIFRGHDGWLYLMAGNGAGIKERVHITEESSPCLFEREASVFRVSPDGAKWECIAAGGRNPPNLGLNYLGDFFSFDSDMEWHVGLPWYRPVRLNHWALGGDQGWQEVGAYPPYFLDALPGILDVGRGSPTWGTLYEHVQLPKKYRDAFLVCDYRWKDQSNDKYSTSGRLLAFFLQREGAGWKASMEVLAKPRPNARDADGKPINFALVDCAVGPDGSLFLTDHNQGVWRIYFDGGSHDASRSVPTIIPDWPPLATARSALIEGLLTLPQPGSERTRLREEAIKGAIGGEWQREVEKTVLSETKPIRQILRGIQLLAPQFASLSPDILKLLAIDPAWEIRSQAAWLCGIRGNRGELSILLKLLDDSDPFVRRRAAEGLTRLRSTEATPRLVEHLGDTNALVRHICMSALAHYPVSQWLERALSRSAPQIRLRALAACSLRRELPSDAAVQQSVRLLVQDSLGRGTHEDQLGMLRILQLFQQSIIPEPSRPGAGASGALTDLIGERLLADFPSGDREVRWEEIRLLGAYGITKSFPKLVAALESEADPVTQFHIAQSLARLSSGWSAEEESRLLQWILATQAGWFAEFKSKGVEFPAFWQTVLTDFAANHREALLRAQPRVDFTSLLGSTLIQLIANSSGAEPALLDLYRHQTRPEVRRKIAEVLKHKSNPKVLEFLRQEELTSAVALTRPERSDAELHRVIMTSASGGKASHGAALYEQLQCHTCHAGAAAAKGESRLFGPELAGVTRRLTRSELADALIYPSKQVADRFKAMEVTLKDGSSFSGFITEQSNDTVTLAERDQVHRFPRAQVATLAPHSASLMPERLLASLTDDEIHDLLAYLETIGTATRE